MRFNFWWSARLFNGLETRLPPLSSQKNKMLVYRWGSTSDDWRGWSMDSKPVCHPSPAKIIKCSFLDYVQLLMIGRAVWWTWTLSATLSSQKNKMLTFGLRSTSDDQASLVNGLRSCPPPLSNQKIKCSFLDYIQLLMICRAGWWTSTPSAILSSQKNKMLIFGLHSISDDWLGWSIDSNPIHHPSPAKKIKCSFLDYVQLLMIGRAGWWTWTPSATPLQSKK